MANTPNRGWPQPIASATAWGDAMDAMILDLDTLLGGVVSTQAGTTYTLALTDTETTVEFTSASAVTVTVPPNSTAAFDVGSSIELYQYGAGQVTVAPGAGVTIRSPLGRLKLASQYAACALRKRATDEWVLEGDLSA